jgi:hypothetical protein
MAEQEWSDAYEPRMGDLGTQEIGRLLRLVKRLEMENAVLRRELATARPLAA